MNATTRSFAASIRAHGASVLFGAVAALTCLSSSAQGRIVVNHDEWTWTDTGFAAAGGSNAATFAQNVASFLDTDGTAGGNVLVYSDNFGFGASFDTALAGAGYTATHSTVTPFTLANLQNYDAVYLAGNAYAENDAVLTAYVNGGGGVFIAGGTGFGGPGPEAATWNGFLGNFGMAFDGTQYNGVAGTLAVTGTHAIFNGVSDLYYNNGNTVLLQAMGNPNASIVQGPGLIAVYDGVTAPVPEPQTYALMLAGLGALAFLARRRSSV